MRQGYYDAEAEIRVNYQKAMAEIMEMIQDQCDDAQLTEDILVLALECESEAKSELAAAEGSQIAILSNRVGGPRDAACILNKKYTKLLV